MKTLELFNAVIEKKPKKRLSNTPYIDEQGYIIEPNALWALKSITSYYDQERINGNDLNKTFHKSWAKIKNSSRSALLQEQILHYISTYQNDFREDIYIPDEIINLPEIKISYKVIKAYSIKEMQDKCLSLLQSGIALKQKTITTIIAILTDELDYTFTGKEGIKNKEAIIIIATYYGIYPKDVVEFLRCIIYVTTNTSLLIKNDQLISQIKNSSYNPAPIFNSYGLEKLAQIFNRYKPLFLAYKGKAPKTINKISKLSKKHHKPLVKNPLNNATTVLLTNKDKHWLDHATPFSLLKALSACYNRKNGQDVFIYRIRNGKSWIKQKDVNKVCKKNYNFILKYLQYRFDLSGKNIYIPKHIKYALPTSEKMFVDNIPTGTRFYGKKLAVGIYWKNAWGAADLDLSGLNIGSKIGWNAEYNQQSGNLLYSGDIITAPDGAVEYLYANEGLDTPTLVKNNVYSGSPDCTYKIIIGQGDNISQEYMMNPNNLLVSLTCNSIQEQTILGIFLPKKEQQCFVLLNFGAGHMRVSGNSQISDLAIKALYQQWNKPLSFNKVVKLLGAKKTKNRAKATYDFSLDTLEKDSFMNLFK